MGALRLAERFNLLGGCSVRLLRDLFLRCDFVQCGDDGHRPLQDKGSNFALIGWNVTCYRVSEEERTCEGLVFGFGVVLQPTVIPGNSFGA